MSTENLFSDREDFDAPAGPAGAQLGKAATRYTEKHGNTVLHGAMERRTVEEKCDKCRGSGRFVTYSGIDYGACHKCKGKGRLYFTQDKATREHQKQQRATRAKVKAQAGIDAFVAAYPAEWEWMRTRELTFGFARAMFEAVTKYHHLTENQLATVQRMIKQDAERDAKRAAEQAARVNNASTVDIARVQTSLELAQSKGLRNPKLRLGDFVFTLAKASSANAGAVYVKHQSDDLYVGKIAAGRLLLSREGGSHEAAVLAVAADPSAAATAYGQRTGNCACCGRLLTNEESIARSIGPICADKFGF